MSDIAVAVEGLGKRYRIAHQRDPYGRLTESLAGALRAPVNRLRGRPRETTEWFWALRDVSFELRQGDVVGVIGRNGAGKTTLLKVLSRITEPSSGSATLRGRVGSLLEVGTGFHPELTGRENVFMSGAVLGMRRAEINRKFDEIVDFAGIEQFLDTPVKRYSSGMQVRLGFAVAAHLDPEILLIDEVLAVGDAAFQRKSLGRLEDVARHGRTVVFVSHDLGAVANLTQSCIYLEGGLVKLFGRTQDVVRAYQLDGLGARDDPGRGLSFYRRSHVPDSPVKIVSLRAVSKRSGAPVIDIGSPLEMDVVVEVSRPIEAVGIAATLKDQRGHTVAILYSPDRGFVLTASAGFVTVRLRVDDLPLAPGMYFIDLGVNQSPQTQAFDVILDYPLVEVENTGQVVQWLERPWGSLQPRKVEWRYRS